MLKQARLLWYVVIIAIIVVSFLITVTSVHSDKLTQEGQMVESDSNLVLHEGNWRSDPATAASAGSYLTSGGSQMDVLTLYFDGSYVEVIYVQHPATGTLAVEIDGVVVRTVSTTGEEVAYGQRSVINYLDADETHTLRVYAVEGVVAVDAFYTVPAREIPAPANPVPLEERQFTGSFMGNPAAIHCQDLGYEYVLIDDSSGQRGVCRFPSGEECDAWLFLQGRCGQQFSYCSQQGYAIETRTDGRDPLSRTYAVCVEGSGRTLGTVTDLTELITKSQGTGCDDKIGLLPDIPGPFSEAEQTELFSETSRLVDLPSSFDWRNHLGSNWLTGVRNQGVCGSCWAFSNIGIVESAYNISRGDAELDINLSEQYLVSDCYAGGDCCGGPIYSTLFFVRNEGVPDEACMSYVDGSGCSCNGGACTDCSYRTDNQCSDRSCDNRCADWEERLVTIDEVGYVGDSQEDIKQALVEHGPLATAMGIQSSFGGYWDGDIYRCSNDSGVSHGVILVGYNDAGNYWIVRNSWGSSWNDDGYFKVGYGECHIESYAHYAEVAIAPPTAVAPTEAALVSPDSVEFRWSASPSPLQHGYEFRVNQSPDSDEGPWLVSTSFTNDTLSYIHDFNAGGVYYWHLRSTTSGTDSSWITTSFQVDVPTESPSDLTANAVSQTQIDLTWQDNSDDESAYHVERSDGDNWIEVAVLASNTTSYQDTAVTCSTTYSYRVRAYRSDSDSFSLYSDETTASTLGCTLMAPINLVATLGDQDQVDLSWDNPNLDATNIYVERSPDATTWSEIAILGANTTVYSDTEIQCSIPYQYRVRVYRAGDSSYSPYSNITGAVSTVCRLEAPTGLTALPLSQTAIQLNWTDNANDETGFVIERTENRDIWEQIALLSANVSQYDDVALVCGETHTYRVRAERNGEYSDYSSSATATTIACPPLAPSSLSAVALSASQIALSWIDNSTDESNFVIERSTDGSEWSNLSTLPANTTQYQDSGLQCNQIFYYRARSYRTEDDQFSTYTAVANATTESCILDAPSNLTATTVSEEQIDLSWVDNANDETAYHIERSIDNGSWSEVAVLGPNVTNYQDFDLRCGTTVNYRVRAIRDNDYSDFSSVADVTTADCPVPAPSGLTISTIDETVLLLSWIDNSDDETGFAVERSSNGTVWSEVATLSETTYRDSGLACATSYSYRVRAYRDDRYSDYSSVDEGTTAACNIAPFTNDDYATTDQDTPVLIDVVSNDNDTDGVITTVTVTVPSANGTVVNHLDGTLTYTPATGFSGTDNFVYIAEDDYGEKSNPATVTITVREIANLAPTANADSATTNQETPVMLNVVLNDVDPDGTLDLTSVTIIETSQRGELTNHGDGTLTYQPRVGFVGEDEFTYTVEDNNGAVSNITTATITVIATPNNAPVAVGDVYIVTVGEPLIMPTPGVLANDSDLDGDSLVASLHFSTSLGALTFNPDGSFVYVPNPGFTGTDSFAYVVSDGHTNSSTPATVTITITPPDNNGPSDSADNGQQGPPQLVTPPSSLMVSATVVAPVGLNFRQYPDLNASRMMVLPFQSTYLVTGRSSDGNWAQLNVEGVVGWAAVEYLSFTGDFSDLPILGGQSHSMPLEGILAYPLANMRVRSGPGFQYPRIDGIGWGQIITVLGQSDDGLWLQIGYANGKIGWSYKRWYRQVSDNSRLPRELPLGLPAQDVSQVQSTLVFPLGYMRVRTGPGFAFPTTDGLAWGETVIVLGQSTDRLWIQVQYGDAQVGWSYKAWFRDSITRQPLPAELPIILQ